MMETHHSSSMVDSANTLRTLKEAGETLADPGQDIRGRDVYAKNGEKIGKVDALFVDDQESKVRFMRLETGGFLGIGERKFLIPIDAITRVDEDQVHLDQTHEKISGSPAYDPDIMAQPEYSYYGGLYNYYGYGPYWGLGYGYPLWW